MEKEIEGLAAASAHLFFFFYVCCRSFISLFNHSLGMSWALEAQSFMDPAHAILSRACDLVCWAHKSASWGRQHTDRTGRTGFHLHETRLGSSSIIVGLCFSSSKCPTTRLKIRASWKRKWRLLAMKKFFRTGQLTFPFLSFKKRVQEMEWEILMKEKWTCAQMKELQAQGTNVHLFL